MLVLLHIQYNTVLVDYLDRLIMRDNFSDLLKKKKKNNLIKYDQKTIFFCLKKTRTFKYVSFKLCREHLS